MQSFQEHIKLWVRGQAVNRSCLRAMNLFICLSLHFQVQETRAAELKVMSEGDGRGFCTADFALCTHSLLLSCTGGRGGSSRSLVKDHPCVMWKIKRHRQLLFIGDGQFGLDGPLPPLRSQQSWYDPFASEFCSFHPSWLLAKPAVLCLCFHVLGILRHTCNLVALLLWDLLSRNHPSCAFIRAQTFWSWHKHLH